MEVDSAKKETTDTVKENGKDDSITRESLSDSLHIVL